MCGIDGTLGFLQHDLHGCYDRSACAKWLSVGSMQKLSR